MGGTTRASYVEEGDEPRQAGMFRRPIGWRAQVALGVVAVISLMLAYTIASERQHRKNQYDRSMPPWSQLYRDGLVRSVTDRYNPSEDVRDFPSPEHTGARLLTFPRILMEPFLTDRFDILVWADMKTTFGRAASGLILGVLISVVLGILMGCYPPVAAYFMPPMFFLSKIPPTAIFAIFFIAVGTEFSMFVTIIAFGVVPILTQSVYHSAMEDVPVELISKAYTLGASQIECIWDVIFKHVLPKVIGYVRLQVGPAMVYLLAAEMLVGQRGFGYTIKIAWRVSDMSIVYVYCIYLGIAGAVIDSALIRLQRAMCPWYSK
jgi:NitT/TauT family transport system permease protein